MSDHDEQRPMTRRERRLREMAETGAMDLSEALQTASEPSSAADEVAPTDASVEAMDAGDDIEIEPNNPDGTPRSRREIRQLREAALAERAAAREAVEPTREMAEPVGGVAEPASDTEEPPDFDTLMTPPTEPFTVDELREAEQTQRADVDGDDDVPSGIEAVETALQDSGDAVPADAATALEDAEAAEESGEASEPAAAKDLPQSKPKRRFPWSRSKDGKDSGDRVAPVASADDGDDAVGAEEELASADAEPDHELADDGPAPGDSGQTASEEAPTEPDVPEAEASEAAASESADSGTGKYSFPDIQPPEEWRSVFDDPASRAVPEQASGAKGDFDDLISRAVAQEGGTGSGTSALILPSMTDDTGGLAGPLGTTGEMYITGSIDLPKSLGETGGHSGLHDSLQMEPISMPEPGETATTSEEGPQPVSAKHAVSARMPSGSSVVAKPTKDPSKLPLILALSGGGLLVIVVGLAVWGATSGMFSG